MEKAGMAKAETSNTAAESLILGNPFLTSEARKLNLGKVLESWRDSQKMAYGICGRLAM
jgi:hypothetical protein